MSCHAVMPKLKIKAWTFVHETQITVAYKLMLLSAKHFGIESLKTLLVAVWCHFFTLEASVDVFE